MIEPGRFAEENNNSRNGKKPETFTFLGFTHYCSDGRNGQFRVKRKTSKKKFNKKVKELDKEIHDRLVIAGTPVPDTIKWLNQVLVGYFHYYGITDNIRQLRNFADRITRILFKWLNRRSQKRSYNWSNFENLLKDFPIAKPKIFVSIYGDR